MKIRGSYILICFLVLCSPLVQSQTSTKQDSLMIQLEERSDPRQQIAILEELWKINAYNNEQDALPFAQRAFDLAEQVEDEQLLTRSYERLAISYGNISDYTNSDLNYKRALELYAQMDNEWGVASIHINLGINYYEQSQYDSALEQVDLARGYFPTVLAKKDSTLLARSLHLESDVLVALGQYTEGLEKAIGSAELNRLLGEKTRYADDLAKIADINESLGNYDDAIAYFNESILWYRELEDLFFEIDACRRLANLYRNKDPIEADSAAHYYKIALDISEKIEAPYTEVMVLIDYGGYLAKVNDFEKANTTLDQGEKIAVQIRDTFGLSDIALYRGKMALQKNSLNEAQQQLSLALKLKTKIGLLSGSADATSQLAVVMSRLGKYKQAYELEKQFKVLSDSLYSIDKAEKFNQLQIRFDTAKKEAAIALQKEEIKTLNEKSRADNLQKGLYAGGMASALALFGLSVFGFRQRIKKNRIAREKQEEIYRQEIAHKKKELASQTLHLVQKNTFLEELKENLENLKSSPERFKMEFRRIVMLLKKEKASDKDWETFKAYFSEVHNDFDQKLKTLSADISEKEIRLAAFLRMNLTTKEIAATMNVLPNSILKSKYRLKKKLGLDKETDLGDFLNTI